VPIKLFSSDCGSCLRLLFFPEYYNSVFKNVSGLRLTDSEVVSAIGSHNITIINIVLKGDN